MKKVCAFFILICLFYTSIHSYTYNLSITAVFKDEGPFLKEWIEYHRLLGVQHFYLYDNNSQDNFKEVLKPYIKKGIVELEGTTTYADFNGTQVDCYNRTLIKARGVTKWLAVIDIDEFICPTGYKKDIVSFLKNYENNAGVVLNWKCFGTSFVKKLQPDQLMIECLTKCAVLTHPMNTLVKSIVKPEQAMQFCGPHHPIYVPGSFGVDTDLNKCEGALSPIKHDKMCINHYWTKDEDFFWNVKVPRRIGFGDPMSSIQSMYDQLNETQDENILRFVPSLKKKVFSK